MDETLMEKGMYVIIADDPLNTRRTHAINSLMRNMRGKEYTIEAVRKTSHGLVAEIGGWAWHPKDLAEACTEKEEQIFHFDIKELQL